MTTATSHTTKGESTQFQPHPEQMLMRFARFVAESMNSIWYEQESGAREPGCTEACTKFNNGYYGSYGSHRKVDSNRLCREHFQQRYGYGTRCPFKVVGTPGQTMSVINGETNVRFWGGTLSAASVELYRYHLAMKALKPIMEKAQSEPAYTTYSRLDKANYGHENMGYHYYSQIDHSKDPGAIVAAFNFFTDKAILYRVVKVNADGSWVGRPRLVTQIDMQVLVDKSRTAILKNIKALYAEGDYVRSTVNNLVSEIEKEEQLLSIGANLMCRAEKSWAIESINTKRKAIKSESERVGPGVRAIGAKIAYLNHVLNPRRRTVADLIQANQKSNANATKPSTPHRRPSQSAHQSRTVRRVSLAAYAR